MLNYSRGERVALFSKQDEHLAVSLFFIALISLLAVSGCQNNEPNIKVAINPVQPPPLFTPTPLPTATSTTGDADCGTS